MKIERFPLQMFEGSQPSEVNAVLVPEGSKFLSVKVLHDGIYVWYEIPELEVSGKRTDTFIIMSPEKSVPENSEFVTILDTIIETPKGQGIMIFPIYKLKQDA